MKDELYHHGIKGQKWGLRRFQNEDGSYKRGAEGRYNDDGSIKSSQTRRLERKGASERQITGSKKYDSKIQKYKDSQSRGKKIMKALLMDPSSEQTYNMARAAGEGRVKSALRTAFDINLGTMAAVGVTSAVSGAIGKKLGGTKGMLIGAAAGTLAGRAVGKIPGKTGTTVSAQQALLRKKYAGRYANYSK